ncbi:MAG: Cold shock protein [Alphaproteobacteria bacterium MarineAlpha6_Bin5]|nr:MAG: Cold shock protein [Alphaproteobacteria bacterium MarineAlpha6_Bin5]
MKGTVKWYNARKGYGFITPDDKSDDVFVHATSLKECGLKKLFTGSEVSFEISEDDKGKRVKSIKVTKEVKEEIPQKKDDKKVEKKDDKKVEKKDDKKVEKKDDKKVEKKDDKKVEKKDDKKVEKKAAEKPKKKANPKKKESSKK